MNGKKITGLFTLALLLALPGCDWFGSHDGHGSSCCGGHTEAAGSGEVLLSLKGNPALYSSDLENYSRISNYDAESMMKMSRYQIK
ncbi:hypothetical protein EBU24_02115, partial [bacterium]|nr:hypothetical protein [bacterium]